MLLYCINYFLQLQDIGMFDILFQILENIFVLELDRSFRYLVSV